MPAMGARLSPPRDRIPPGLAGRGGERRGGDFRRREGEERRDRLLSQKNGHLQISRRNGTESRKVAGAGRGHNHFLQECVERWVEGLPPPIQKFEQQGIAALFPALEPKGQLLIDKHALSIHGEPQAPARGVAAQTLQGGIDQQPVEQQGGRACQAGGADGNQLGAARRWQGGRVGRQAMEADLLQSQGTFVRLSPGLGGVDSQSMAARSERRHLQLSVHEGTGWLPVKLHHQMGAQAQGAGIDERPVRHLQSEGPGASGKEVAIGGSQDAHPRIPILQSSSRLLHPLGRGHFLQAPPGVGARGPRRGGSPSRDAPAQGFHRCGGEQELQEQSEAHGPRQPLTALPTSHAGSSPETSHSAQRQPHRRGFWLPPPASWPLPPARAASKGPDWHDKPRVGFGSPAESS